jgi:hypothetical protein
MNPTLFDNLQQTLAASGPDAALHRLCAQLREQGDYGNLFYALLMKRRHELGVLPVPTAPAQSLPASVHERYEAAIREAGSTVGRLYLDAGDIPRAWAYYRMIGETGPVREAIDQFEPGEDEQSGSVIEIAFHHGVHPCKGFDWILQRYGICNAITTVTSQDFGNALEVRAHCVKQLVRALYHELRERLKADIERREGPVEDDPGVRELLQGRAWLTGEDCYHVDVSHLTAVVQMSIHLPPGEEIGLARELCLYGSQLSDQFQCPGDPPFEDHYRDYGVYLSILAGEDVEAGIEHFRRKASEADPIEVGTYPAQVLVNLLLRLDRPKDALAVARRFLASADPGQISCPSIPDLCQRAGDYQTLAEVAREQNDPVHFLAGLLAGTATK